MQLLAHIGTKNELLHTAEMISNEILKPFNEILAGCKSMLQIQNVFYMKSWIKGYKIHQQEVQHSTRSRLNRLYCLAGGLNALQSKISCKIHTEPMKNPLKFLSCWKVLQFYIEFFQNTVCVNTMASEGYFIWYSKEI